MDGRLVISEDDDARNFSVPISLFGWQHCMVEDTITIFSPRDVRKSLQIFFSLGQSQGQEMNPGQSKYERKQ
jgi:hypothetical protein